jgi:hypothetical protein
MNRSHKPKPVNRDIRKRRQIVLLRDAIDLLQVRPAGVPSERPFRRRILFGLLRVPLAVGCWTALLLLQVFILLGYGLRYVLQLPIFALTVFIVALQWVSIRLVVARINIAYRDDEPTRVRLLDELNEAVATAYDDESEADE